jgi:hypothetical protein
MLCIGGLVELVNVAILFKIHFTCMMGGPCHGVLFMVYVGV